jgi:protein-tyrosine phosphatase
MPDAARSPADADQLPPGRIDLHSHLIPGIDDGCQTLDESFDCVRQLCDAGYVATLCTPHIWTDMFPANGPANIRGWADDLQQTLRNAGFDYTIWPGGEMRLHENIIDWFQHNGVPTLAGTPYVLMDFWTPTWPDWLHPAVDWLKEQGYTPILAHPERTTDKHRLIQRLRALNDRGVLFQGNCLPFTGAEGPEPKRIMQQLLSENRYDFIALDMHGPDTLPERLRGLEQLRKTLGDHELDYLTCEAPRVLLRQAKTTNHR